MLLRAIFTALILSSIARSEVMKTSAPSTYGAALTPASVTATGGISGATLTGVLQTAVPAGLVDLSTVTAALALKANLAGGNTFTGAQNINGGDLTISSPVRVNNGYGIYAKEAGGTGREVTIDHVGGIGRIYTNTESSGASPLELGTENGVSFTFDQLVLGIDGNTTSKWGFASSSLTVNTSDLVCNAPGYANKCGVGTATPGANLDVAGNAQFGTAPTKSTFTVTAQLVTPKIMLSKEGGYLVKMVNASGVTVTTGTVVNSTASATDYGFKVNPPGGYQPIGVVYGPLAADPVVGSCVDAASCWVCVSGICPVYTEGSCTRGQWMGASNTTSGMADCADEPASVGKHDQEVGHNIVVPVAGISWGIVHFR